MKLTVIKTLEELRPVLKDPGAAGPDPAYWVFRDIVGSWKNMTVIPPGNYNGEFTKTFGHYNLNPGNEEVYKCISGHGVFVLQKKHRDEKGNFDPDNVGEIQILRINVGQEVNISREFGHVLINIGDDPLITYDNQTEKHPPEDYEPVARMHGLAYYVIKQGDKVKVVPNPNYKNLGSSVLEDTLS